TIDGAHAASNTGTNGAVAADPTGAVMDTNGSLTFNVPDPPAPTASGSSTGGGAGGSSGSTATGTGPDTLTLHVSGDMYNGNSQIQVLVDGQQVGGTYDVTAHHSQGQWQDINIAGNFDPSVAHQVQVQFVNDAWDGQGTTDGHDRNVYVGSITLNGQTIDGAHAASNTGTNGAVAADPTGAVMDTNGSLTFNAAAQSSSSGASGTSTPPALTPAFQDGSGHEIFVFNAVQSGAHIANFQSGQDLLDLAPLLKASGYTGTNPLADHVVNLVQSGTDSTAVTLDPTGHDASHATTVVTLDHVSPNHVGAADFWH
ncbi:MAG TPA: carbohydrate-binding domain-containing protein, partial [Stellaceae bacterium]